MIRTKTTFADLCEMDPRLRDLEADIRRHAAAVRRQRSRCANAAWYGYGPHHGHGFKTRVVELVGHDRMPVGFVKPPAELGTTVGKFRFYTLAELTEVVEAEAAAIAAFLQGQPVEVREREKFLRTSTAYDLAYDHLYALLPACRRCPCL